jgi:hypothetical protein
VGRTAPEVGRPLRLGLRAVGRAHTVEHGLALLIDEPGE